MASIKLIAEVSKILPSISGRSLYKGQAGKIGVIGGSFEYTGAPYYAAISALKMGADLSHIFCCPEAAVPIKSYSPEIIVHPLLPGSGESASSEAVQNSVRDVVAWFPALHSLIIGPGLGRDPGVLEASRHIILAARKARIPMLLDADGLFLVAQDLTLINGYERCILTPNQVEYKRLCRAATADQQEDLPLHDLCSRLGNVSVLRKGATDAISIGLPEQDVEVSVSGSGRRCGGQGDVLSGCTGTLLAWAFAESDRRTSTSPSAAASEPAPTDARILAAFGGCLATRHANEQAVAVHRRGTTTPDIIAALPAACESIWPCGA